VRVFAQYLYFCTSKASKLGTTGRERGYSGRSGWQARAHYSRSICTFVLVKPVNWVPQVESADILVAAAGKPGLIKGQWIKEGAVVIDVGEEGCGTLTLLALLVLKYLIIKGHWIKEGAVVIDVGEEGSGCLLYLLY
jgi:hypothetical protein